MTRFDDLQTRFADTRILFREKIGGSRTSLGKGVSAKAHRLPRWARRRARALAAAEPLLAHPKLRLTLDVETLGREVDELQSYLRGIDLQDRRKGWWLGMLGGMVFNLLVFFALLVVGLRYFGLI
ncbi:MAG: hypothetical protein OIF47_12080 [Marinibacterium sp.]|nr:hypothetical protein [Marinibacterium sp.]